MNRPNLAMELDVRCVFPESNNLERESHVVIE